MLPSTSTDNEICVQETAACSRALGGVEYGGAQWPEEREMRVECLEGDVRGWRAGTETVEDPGLVPVGL